MITYGAAPALLQNGDLPRAGIAVRTSVPGGGGDSPPAPSALGGDDAAEKAQTRRQALHHVRMCSLLLRVSLRSKLSDSVRMTLEEDTHADG